MAELEYGTVVGQYRLVSAGTERAAQGVVRFTPVEPDETTDFATVYTREAFTVTLDEDGWLRSEGGQVDELRVPAGRWEVTFRNVPGLTVKPFQFDVPAGETVILPQVQPLVPTPAVKFVVNEQVYTETLAARVAAEDARDIAVQAAEDATAPTEQVVDARIDAKRNTANGLAPLGPDSKVPLARIPVDAIASSAEVGAVVDDALEPALTDITDLKTKTTTGYLAPARVAPLVSGKLPEANVPDRLTEPALFATIAGSAFGIAANSRPRGNRTVLMGDSITAYNGGPSTATPVQSLSGFSSLGMWRWANIMLRQRLDIIGNSGIGGQEASQIRARFVTDVMALNPDILALLAGTNDDGPEDTTWDHLQWMYETALAAGIFIVAFTIPPQAASVAGNTSALQSYRQGVNNQIRQFVRSHAGMLLIDLADLWQDKTQPGFVARAEYVPDGTHPGTLGAQVGGYAIACAIAPVLPAVIEAAPSSAAPDNMLTNGRFAGSGTAAPSGWSSTGSPSFAYVPGRDGIGQRLAVTVPVGSTATLTQNINKGVLLREGDAYDFTVDIEPYDLEAAGASTQRINTFVQAYDGSSFTRGGDAVYVDGGAQYGSARYPARSGRFRTQRAVFGAGRNLVQVVITLNGGGTYLLSEAVARNLTMLEAGIAAPENVPHTNLIANGTFETDTTDWSGGASAVVARSTAQKHSGAASMSIQHTADANSDGRYKKVAVAPSTPLNYVAWVNAPAGFAGKMNFNWYIGGGAFISQTSVTFTGTGQWQKLIGTVSASSVPATAGDMLLTIGRGEAVGTPMVYVDDVDCWQV